MSRSRRAGSGRRGNLIHREARANPAAALAARRLSQRIGHGSVMLRSSWCRHIDARLLMALAPW
jgi:hypothetical protein